MENTETLKEQLSDPSGSEDLETTRSQLSEKVVKYKDSYQKLKEMKIEIEHLQHLLEQARHRLTRDFEHWYMNVYLAAEEPETHQPEGVKRSSTFFDSMTDLTAPSAGASARLRTVEGITNKSHSMPARPSSSFSTATIIAGNSELVAEQTNTSKPAWTENPTRDETPSGRQSSQSTYQPALYSDEKTINQLQETASESKIDAINPTIAESVSRPNSRLKIEHPRRPWTAASTDNAAFSKMPPIPNISDAKLATDIQAFYAARDGMKQKMTNWTSRT